MTSNLNLFTPDVTFARGASGEVTTFHFHGSMPPEQVNIVAVPFEEREYIFTGHAVINAGTFIAGPIGGDPATIGAGDLDIDGNFSVSIFAQSGAVDQETFILRGSNGCDIVVTLGDGALMPA